MEGTGLGVASNDEDSAYDSPRSTEHSLSPTSPPRVSGFPGSCCNSCSSSLRETRVLPCHHSFCKSCLPSPLPGSRLVCPDCAQEFPLPSLTTSAVSPISADLLLSIKPKLVCMSCSSERDVIKKCTTCNCYLCIGCSTAHAFNFCFNNHNVIDMTKDKELVLSKDFIYCKQHPTELANYLCYTCMSNILCEICISESHADTTHFIEDLSLLDRDMKSVKGKSNLESLHHDLLECLKSDTAALLDLQVQYQEVLNRISQVYEYHSNQLLKYKEQQLAVLQNFYHHMISAIKSHSKTAQDTILRLDRLSKTINSLIEQGKQNLLPPYIKLLEKEILNVQDVQSKIPTCKLKYEPDCSDFDNVLAKNFGQVIFNLNGATNEVPEALISNGPYSFKYEKWSSTCFDNLSMFSNLQIGDDLPRSRSYHLKSSIARTTISYSWKFGAFGTEEGHFTEPNGVCINSAGDIIIADTNNNRVQVFDRTGKFKFSLGDGVTGKGTLLFPNRVAVMEKSGDIVVTERAPTHQVQVYNQYGQFIRKFGATILQHPRAVAVDKDGFIIVVECKVMRIIIFDMFGNIRHKFSCTDTLQFPNGVAVNDKKEIFVSDNRTHCVVVYNYQGKLLKTIGQEGLTNYPIGVMLNKDGHVIVADNHNNFNLTVFTQDGEFIAGVESKAKHAQCYDAAIAPDGTVALTSKDYRVYVYNTSF